MSGTLAEIHNLNDAVAWTSAGNWAKAILRWSGTDPDGTISAWRVRIYSAATAGTTFYDSGKTLGNPGFVNSTYALINLTSYWWTIELWDNLDESSGESTRTEFKVCWGQGIYEYIVVGGAATSGWAFSSAALPSGTQSAFVYRNATAAAGVGAGAWKKSLSEVVPAAYLNVMVRLATYVNLTQPALDNMTFTYAGGALTPDKWTRSPAADWTLDPSGFRYGTRGFKWVVTDNTTDRYVYPFRIADGSDIIVMPSTAYVFSCWVNTHASLGVNASELRLEIYAGGGLSTLLAQGTVNGDTFGDGPGATINSMVYPEGWQRLHLRYTTGPGTTLLRPLVRYANGGTGNGDYGWIDAAQLEEGVVVSPWHPGQVTPAGVYDGYGLMLNAQAGAVGRFKGSTGTEVNLDQIVNAAAPLHFGSGSPEGVVTAPVGHMYLRSDGSTITTLYVKTSGSGNTGWTAK